MALTLTPKILTAAHLGVKSAIEDAGPAGQLVIYSASGTELSILYLTHPCGTVSSQTGRLTLTFAGRDDEASATGTASYARLYNALWELLIGSISCVSGTAPVADSCVLSTLDIVAGSPVEGISFTIG